MVDFKKLNERMKRDKEQGIQGKQLATFDCETTGSKLHHNCLPFMVCFTFEDKRQITYEWDVDPYTRKPQLEGFDVQEICQLLNDPQYLWIGHNIKFDVRCIEKASDYFGDITFDPIMFLKASHDTMLMSHALDNLGSHGLKDLTVRYLDIPEDDVAMLKQKCEYARAYGKQVGWKIASKENCPYETKAPDGGWWIIDMWIAQVYAKLHGTVSTECKTYCLRDTERTLLLFSLLREELNKEKLWDQYLRNQAMLSVTYKMEQNGISINREALLSERKRLINIASAEDERAKRLCNRNVNFNAPENKANILAEVYGCNDLKRKTKTGKNTVNKDELEILYSRYESLLEEQTGQRIFITDEVDGVKQARFVPREKVEELLEFTLALMARAKCFKAANSDLVNYQTLMIGYQNEDSTDYYMHQSINITGTGTTRFSCSEPGNNVSKGKAAFNEAIKQLELSLRKIFQPTKGRKWWSIDYEQIQLITAAVRAGETETVEHYKQGGDLHEHTHRKLAEALDWVYDPDDDGQRTIAKNTNFGFWFGAGPKKIDKTTHTTGLHPILCKVFPKAHEQIKNDIRFVDRHGYIEASGYRLYVPQDEIFTATVYACQGWEGVIMKRAMQHIDEWCESNPDYDVHMIMVNHDDLVFDVPEDCPDEVLFTLMQLMEDSAYVEGVPCRTEAKIILKDWSKGKKVRKPEWQ